MSLLLRSHANFRDRVLCVCAPIQVCMLICSYAYTLVYACVFLCVYKHICMYSLRRERERESGSDSERERERQTHLSIYIDR